MNDVKLGVALPNFLPGANVEAVEAAADTAERLGWHSAMTTDHLLVPHSAADTYGDIFDAVAVLGHLAARTTRLLLGTSVIVVPMRNAVVLAKELATIDSFSRGRLIAGVGVGWNTAEFANVGVADRFGQRGRYLDETIRLWRHLWSGTEEPFHGRFFDMEDFVFGPRPAQPDGPPIWIGGRSEPALRRAGRLGDAYHSSSVPPDQYATFMPTVRAAAADAGRPEPLFSARITVRFDEPAPASGFVAAGDDDAVAAVLARYLEAGVQHLLIAFGEVDAERVVAAMERFDREIRPRLSEVRAAA
jgi:probable F420-dependent oxidoreductase